MKAIRRQCFGPRSAHWSTIHSRPQFVGGMNVRCHAKCLFDLRAHVILAAADADVAFHGTATVFGSNMPLVKLADKVLGLPPNKADIFCRVELSQDPHCVDEKWERRFGSHALQTRMDVLRKANGELRAEEQLKFLRIPLRFEVSDNSLYLYAEGLELDIFGIRIPVPARLAPRGCCREWQPDPDDPDTMCFHVAMRAPIIGEIKGYYGTIKLVPASTPLPAIAQPDPSIDVPAPADPLDTPSTSSAAAQLKIPTTSLIVESPHDKE